MMGLARGRNRKYITKTVQDKLVADEVAAGWKTLRHNRASTVLCREKPLGEQLEDRVWMLLYRMGFTGMSGKGGATLNVDRNNANSATSQIDVVGIDDEVALGVECKSAASPPKRSDFQEDLGKLEIKRANFAHAVNTQFQVGHKRAIVLAFFTSNIILTESDRERAAQLKIVLFDEADLAYYEALVAHLGPASRYQFFSDMMPGREVPGLALRVPAVRTKMGGHNCYAFSISPEYLLKIAYVSHRSKGKASDVNTYQRMLSKPRMRSIRDYISNGGVFPTNILISLDRFKKAQFERVGQQADRDDGVLGVLDLRPSYKSAWIIDGQHRLYAYSGNPKAKSSLLPVLAFEGLPASKQARMFTDINAKQKSVKQSLLRELYAELNWDASEPSVRVQAIVSKAVQALDIEPGSPFFKRILLADGSRDTRRCISLTSVCQALEKPGMFIDKERSGQVLDPGPLWTGANDATLKRTIYVISKWFSEVANRAEDWWNAGAEPGGGLAMGEGVTVCINVLRSVFEHLRGKGAKLVQLDNDDLADVVRPYAVVLGDYFAGLTSGEREAFRRLRGVQGQTAATRHCQKALNTRFPDFQPDGLAKFLDEEKAQTNLRAKELVDQIERTLQRTVIEELKAQFGSDETQWWVLGVPKLVRKKISERFEEEDGKRGGKEHYFDLMDYRPIALDNWQIFEDILGKGKSGSKDKRTAWMVGVNEIRKIVSHVSSGVTVTIEQLCEIQDLAEWLDRQVGVRDEFVESEAIDLSIETGEA
jgi:DGQHR domain-containing protein